jgi:hypothetical protein
MYRALAKNITPMPQTPNDVMAGVLKLHPVQLHRYLDEAWSRGGSVPRIEETSTKPKPTDPVYLGDSATIVKVLDRGDELRDDSGIPRIDGPQPWEHLIYAYLLENAGMVRILRRVIELYATGEALEVPQDETRHWLRATEELFFRDPPPFHIGSLTSFIRPDLEAVRRNAYWRLLGMDLDHGGADGRPYPFSRVGAANVDFVANFEQFLREVWQGYLNRMNSSGENAYDPEAVANRAELLAAGLRVRRRQGNLAREEFFFTAMLSWFHLLLESDNTVIVDLKAQATNPAERLRKIGERVGIQPHPRARNLIEMAEAASTILRLVELEVFSDISGVGALTEMDTSTRSEALEIITHWSAATGRNLKVRLADLEQRAPRTGPIRAGVPGAATAARQEMQMTEVGAMAMNGDGR